MKYLFIFAFFLNSLTLNASDLVQAATLSNDVYLPPAQFIQKYESKNYRLVPAKVSGVQFYIFVQKEQLWVVFEGTDNLQNIETDLDISEMPFRDENSSRVHAGYYKEALEALEVIRPYLHQNMHITVTGHSLGGAVAHLLSALLYKEGYDVTVYTFGAPPVGNAAFVKSIRGLKHERYTHIFDIIPLLKKSYVEKIKEAMGYVHEQLPEDVQFESLIAAVDALPYDYVHQGSHHYLYNSGTLPLHYETLPWYEKVIVRARLYHSSPNYLEAVR